MASELLYDALDKFGRRRLGGSTERAALGQPARIFDLVLDSALAPVWSILYMPPQVTSPFFPLTVVNSNTAIGRLSMSQGGSRPLIVDFDWGTGGVLQVPACNVQLDVVIPEATATDGGEFSAFAVPSPIGARGGWQPNTFTVRLTGIPSVAPALFFAVPALARSWSIGGQGGGAVAGISETFILASDGTGLETWNKDFAANNASGIATLEDQHILPRRASVFSVLQAPPGTGITTLSYRFHLAI